MTSETPKPSKGALAYQGIYRSTPVPSCVLSRDDLIRLYEELAEKAREGLESSLKGATRPADTSEEEFEELKEEAREVGRLSALIYGADGEQIAVSSLDDFRSQRLPDEIASITYNSATSLETVQGWKPDNRFRLTLDFTEPPGFDRYDPTSNPTPNESSFEIIGPNSTWVTGVYETVMGYLEGRGRRRKWLHQHGTYNVFQWFLAIPGALWLVVRLSEAFGGALSQWHTALEGALYVYLFLVTFMLLRGVVYVLRWAYPLVELEGSRSKGVRSAISLALSSLLLAGLYDVLKVLVL